MNARLIGFFVALTALMATALSTGRQIYYLLALTLMLLIVLSAAAVLWSLASVKVDVKGVKPRVNRGDTLMTILAVRHTSLLPVAALRVGFSAPSGYAGGQEISFAIPPFQKRIFRHTVTCAHRGVYPVGVTNLSARDLFGLMRVSRKSGLKPMRVEVLPRVTPVMPIELKASDTGPEYVSRSALDASSPSDIRAWQDGDELKHVHWKLTMRRKVVMVRTYEESARPDTLIIPDLSAIQAMNDQALSMEDCVCEACASAASAQLAAGYPVRMPLTCRTPSEISGQFPQDFPPFLDALMRVKFDSPYAYEQVLITMLSRMSRTGGAVLVTAKMTTRVADLAERMARSGVRTKLVWVTDTRRAESLQMIERLKMEGVMVERANPWSEMGYGSAQAPEAQSDFEPRAM